MSCVAIGHLRYIKTFLLHSKAGGNKTEEITLFYSTKPSSQVSISKYQNWPIHIVGNFSGEQCDPNMKNVHEKHYFW